jgi:hypothetical protein
MIQASEIGRTSGMATPWSPTREASRTVIFLESFKLFAIRQYLLLALLFAFLNLFYAFKLKLSLYLSFFLDFHIFLFRSFPFAYFSPDDIKGLFSDNFGTPLKTSEWMIDG